MYQALSNINHAQRYRRIMSKRQYDDNNDNIKQKQTNKKSKPNIDNDHIYLLGKGKQVDNHASRLYYLTVKQSAYFRKQRLQQGNNSNNLKDMASSLLQKVKDYCLNFTVMAKNVNGNEFTVAADEKIVESWTKHYTKKDIKFDVNTAINHANCIDCSIGVELNEILKKYGWGQTSKVECNSYIQRVGDAYSIIHAMASGFNIGIVNCSHLLKCSEDEHHKFHRVLDHYVYVPKGCCILFRRNLLHYGAQATFHEDTYMKSTRYFGKIAPKNYLWPVSDNVKKICPDTNFCKGVNICSICQEIMNVRFYKFLIHSKERYCDEFIEKMNSGKILYGNIDTLGWVVIKGMNFLDIDKATETLTHLANRKSWHSIHRSQGGAKRCQLVDYALISDVSTTNMEAACNFGSKPVFCPIFEFRDKIKPFLFNAVGKTEETHEFLRDTILINDGNIPDQYHHCDFPRCVCNAQSSMSR